MSYKYIRFFTIAGRMQWDSVKDEADLQKRIVSSFDASERQKFDDEQDALKTPGGFVLIADCAIVRVA